MELIGQVAIVFSVIVVLIFIVGALTKEKDCDTRAKYKPIEPNDTWEKRYFSLVQEIWYLSDEELEDLTYEDDHEDVMIELREMNEAVHEHRTGHRESE